MTFNYAEVGATRGEFPSGYRHFRRTTTLAGVGLDVMGDLLLDWELQRRVGARVDGPPVAPGVRADLRVGVGPVGVTMPVEVVYVVDEPGVRGFAYGTLEGHPERGEAAYTLTEKGPDLEFEIKAFSRPDLALLHLAGPLVGVGVEVVIQGLLAGMRSLAHEVRGHN